MTATLRRIDGRWYLDHVYTSEDRPILIGVRWAVTEWKSRGIGVAPDLADGMVFTYAQDGQWGHYAGQGNHWALKAEKQGTALPEVNVPPPNVRAGTETRWYRGQWQKYLKTKGWIAA